jgi:hypothetical protein
MLKKLLTTLVVSAMLPVLVLAEASVTPISLDSGSKAEVSGNISEGKKIPLQWAESSAVACFPGTRFEQFDGNHVFYRVPMPAASSLKIKLTPKNGSKVNLYALRQSAGGPQPVPPNVTSAISAEASYPIYARKVGGKIVSNPDDGIRKIDFISVDQPYSILIGVAGAHGAAEGEFSLQVEVAPR